MKLLLLGAGASKAYQDPTTKVRMPIARDFLKTFHSLPISANPWVLVGNVLHYATRYRKMELPEVFTSDIDIEELHSEVQTRMLVALQQCRDSGQFTHEAMFFHATYVQLVCLFASTINEIQKADASPAHISLARTLGPADTVVTFNWDTLMDRALDSLGAWRTDYGYGLGPHQVFRNGWESTRHDPPANFVRLLKLHGSTNWITSYIGIDNENFTLCPLQTASSDRLYVYEYTRKPYATYAGRFMDGYSDFSYGYYPPNLQDDPGKAAPPETVRFMIRPKHPFTPEGAADDSGLVSMPLIIPPVKDKSYALYGELFTRLWAQASNALSAADEIAIVGYSFPRTDHQSLTLFKNAFVKRTTIPQVVILDPEPARVMDIFHREFGIPRSHVREMREYFTPDFDSSRLWRLPS